MEINLKLSFISIISLLSGLLLFTSCEKQEDKYSIGDFIVSFGIVEKSPETIEESYTIRLDNGDRFVNISPSQSDKVFKFGQRVFVNFAPYEDKISSGNSKTIYGKINLIQSVLYKDILKMSQINKDSIGKDPVIVRESWITGDSILNIGFNYYTEGSIHTINLVDIAQGNGREKPFIFEFQHNAKQNRPQYRASGYVSFKLNGYKIPGQQKVDFAIRYTDYEGKMVDVPHTIAYK